MRVYRAIMDKNVGIGERIHILSGFAKSDQFGGNLTSIYDIVNFFFEALVMTVGVIF
ncbi:hypothetical protein D3C73_1135780 [compost metagenome]